MSPLTAGPTRSSIAAPNPIWEAFETERDGVQLYCWDGSDYRSHDWDDWRAAAERAAVGLRRLCVRPGSRVASVLTNQFEVCAAVIGTWLAGGTLLSMPTLRRGQEVADYLAQLRRLCQDSEPEVMLLEKRFIDLLGDEDLGAPVASFESLGTDGTLDPTPPPDDAPAFVQYSSGSTSEPKGCVLSMGAIGAQERMLAQRLEVDGDGMGVTWLPLSHDMGLFGCVLVSWTAGLPLAVGTPERFLRKPTTWMDDCAAVGATITVSPNFGLGLATRRARSRPPRGRFPLRTMVLGGERIEWSTISEAAEVLGPCGVEMHTMTPAYGLAEATLAVAMKRIDELPTSTWVDAEAAYRGELVVRRPGAGGSLAMVSCGPPMDGVSVRIGEDEDLGRICIGSEALALRYLNAPEQTRRRFRNGELISEDIGFVRDGELYVLGRTDDAIPIGGRNVYARDVELALGDCAGARPGCATLVDLEHEDGRRLVLIAEPTPEGGDPGEVADSMAKALFRAVGVRAEELVLLRPGSLPKTPSGKIQRFRCRALLAGNGADVIDRVPM